METTAAELLQELEACGTAQNRKVYSRHGVKGPQYGVSYANLGRLRKKIKKNHSVAKELWASGNHDARVLATMIADPGVMSEQCFEIWARDLGDYVLTDAFSKLVAASEHAEILMRSWMDAEEEWKGQAAWSVLAEYATRKPELPDSYFMPYMDVIQRYIHERHNRVRHSMNMALIAIGLRGGVLESEAFRAAAAIGKVQVDHGETSCTTPDAASYMRRGIARRDARERKKNAGK